MVARRVAEVFGPFGGSVVELQREDAGDRGGERVEAARPKWYAQVSMQMPTLSRPLRSITAHAVAMSFTAERVANSTVTPTPCSAARSHTPASTSAARIDGDVGPPAGEQDVDERAPSASAATKT